MLENYDARRLVDALRLAFEREHSARPFDDSYARGARRAFDAFSPTDPAAPPDPELLGAIEAVLQVVEELGPEPARMLLARDRG